MSEFEIFAAAIKIVDREARARFVHEQCKGDAEKETAVHRLLAEYDRNSSAESLLSGDPNSESAAATEDFQPARLRQNGANEKERTNADDLNRVIEGKYKLVQRIGQGGMGTVFMAVRVKDVSQKVALKLIRADRSSASAIARFNAERQALAVMDHPNIAKFLDAGTSDRGETFFVMELVMGKSIVKYCDEHQLGVTERIELFVQVCRGVQHAHQKGVIHRDLKPGNILVAEYDGVPQAKVIDFGLAKALAEPLTDDPDPTLVGQILGTVQYMSPEQATFNQLDVDTQSDVYSLTVVLYELLTGSTPHSRGELAAAALEEQLRIIRELDPPRASDRLSSSDALPSVAAYRKSEPKRLTRSLRGELDALLMKGLEKERNRRYSNPSALAEDLERFLRGEPVQAVPPSRVYLFRKFLRRRWREVAVGATIFVSIFAGIIAYFVSESRRAEERYRREVAESKAIVAQTKADVAKREAASSEYVGLMGRIQREKVQRAPGWTERMRTAIKTAAKLETPFRNETDLRSEIATLRTAYEYRLKPDWEWKKDTATGISYSRSGKLLAITPKGDLLKPSPHVRIFNTDDGSERFVLWGTDNVPPLADLIENSGYALRSRFDGCYFCGGDRYVIAWTKWGKIYRWDLSTEPPSPLVRNIGTMNIGLQITPDGKHCVVQHGVGGPLRSFDVATLNPLSEPIEMKHACLVSGGSQLYAFGPEKTLRYSIPELKAAESFDFVKERPMVMHPAGAYLVNLLESGRFQLESLPDNGVYQKYADDHRSSPANESVVSSNEYVRKARFSGNGAFLFAIKQTERNTFLNRYDTFGGALTCRIEMPSVQVAKWDVAAVNHDGSRIALITDYGIAQYSAATANSALIAVPAATPDGVRFARVSPNGREIALQGERRNDGGDRVHFRTLFSDISWPGPAISSKIGSAPPHSFDALAYSPSGRRFALPGNNSNTQATFWVHNRDKNSLCVAMFNDLDSVGVFGSNTSGLVWLNENIMVAALQHTLFAWEIDESEASGLTAKFLSHSYVLSALGKTRKIVTIAAIGESEIIALTELGHLRQYEFKENSFRYIKSWELPNLNLPRCMRLSPDKRYFSIADSYGAMILFDSDQKTIVAEFDSEHSAEVRSMWWIDAETLATGSIDGKLCIWKVSSAGKPQLHFRLNLDRPIVDLSAPPNGNGVFIALANEISLRFLDLNSLEKSFSELLNEGI